MKKVLFVLTAIFCLLFCGCSSSYAGRTGDPADGRYGALIQDNVISRENQKIQDLKIHFHFTEMNQYFMYTFIMKSAFYEGLAYIKNNKVQFNSYFKSDTKTAITKGTLSGDTGDGRTFWLFGGVVNRPNVHALNLYFKSGAKVSVKTADNCYAYLELRPKGQAVVLKDIRM